MKNIKKTDDIRRAFLEYFRKNDHTIVPSFPLIPEEDASLLFTSAGMVPFKKIFLGEEHSDYKRAVSTQCCMRANDLENVGYTARHHTFFEMLGNFSFGDYFKQQAIQYAWDFLTHELQIPAERLLVTVHNDDEEAHDIWLNDIKVDPARVITCGDQDNFWSMGETGPCGPCSEIFYDHGPKVPGVMPGQEGEEGERYVEIWNLVFMQYNRDAEGHLSPLPQPSIDTGMGLERVVAVMQGVHSNYDIDIFQHLIKVAAKVTCCEDLAHPTLKILADHIRASAFLIIEGIQPSREGRGYVLRRIIRRALRHGYQLGMRRPFFFSLVEALVKVMGYAYPTLIEKQNHIAQVLMQEEEQFSRTLASGITLFERAISQLSAGQMLPGNVVFKLYDTYGFPVDLTTVMATERQIKVDHEGFMREMKQQQDLSKRCSQFQTQYDTSVTEDKPTEFTGYDRPSQNSQIIGLYQDCKVVERLVAGERGAIVLEKTPFFAEAGGQVSDRGEIRCQNNVFFVEDVQKSGRAFLHIGFVQSGRFQGGDKIIGNIDRERRHAISANHSATHLLHASLHQILGQHVIQKGSFIDVDRLRFDFSAEKPMTSEEIQAVEQLLNEQIRKDMPIIVQLMSVDEAKQSGAMALFGRKYGQQVRVLEMEDFSREICGGTHVLRTGEIGLFKIVSEGGIAAGMRRIEAVTGLDAENWVYREEDILSAACDQLNTTQSAFNEKLRQILSKEQQLEQSVIHLTDHLVLRCVNELISTAKEIHHVQVVISRVDDLGKQGLRQVVDQLKSKLTCAVIVLAAVRPNQKIDLIAGVSQECVERVSAGSLVQMIAEQVGGEGGGRADLAQGGGNAPRFLDQALKSAEDWLKARLK